MEAISLTLNISANSWSNLVSKEVSKSACPEDSETDLGFKDSAEILGVEEEASNSKPPRFL